MHLITLNDPDLLIGLWHGTLKPFGSDKPRNWEWRTLIGDAWEAHGKAVTLCAKYIPSSFGRTPRNPAEKINSGYKAWEFLIWIFWLGPVLLRHILPHQYWQNYCRFVQGCRIFNQYQITRNQLQHGHRLLLDFIDEFEDLYYQRQPERIHFVRQSIHLLSHLSSETVRLGPPAYYAQWTMETLIGNLGKEVRQPGNPFSNISERGVLRTQMNVVHAMFPDLELIEPQKPPKNSLYVGEGYRLLRAKDKVIRHVTEVEGKAIMEYWNTQGWPNSEAWPRAVRRWARLQLPNGQIARSKWGEERSRRKLRCTRMVKVRGLEEYAKFAEIYYYFELTFEPEIPGSFFLAVGSIFSSTESDQILRNNSMANINCYQYQGDADLMVFPVQSILSVVAMVPFFTVTAESIIQPKNKFFLVEKPGLELSIHLETLENDEEYNDGDTDEGE
ncbi:hypothetical protein BDN72DRAFT_782146 [Pluteus cervinus]|uniref:Uncharacterized protein n=1 Tax=Pluteus cervinus TaxID=181527 RepID=A0ACD2ZYI0_9AGAR|nr:hypothetical protein BDN72DRAFT_782146 [Pluteus cervinus]